MKLSEIIDCHRILTSMKQKYYPGPVMFPLIHNLRNLTPVVEDYNLARNAIIDKYAKRDENGNVSETVNGVLIKDRTGFQNEMNALLNTETEIAFDKIDKDSLDICGTEKFDELNMEQRMMIEDYMV